MKARNQGKFKKGCRFKGDVNHHEFEVLDVYEKTYKYSNSRTYSAGMWARILDKTTGKVRENAVSQLEHSLLSIV